MMADPGSISSIAPAGEDYLVREIAQLKTQMRELPPSVAQSFQTTVDALTALVASTVLPQASSNSVAGLATSTTSTVQTSVEFTVPDGYTQALVVGTATAMAYNNTAGTDYIYAEVIINGVSGGELYAAAGAGIAAGVNAPYFTTMTGLTAEETITVSSSVRTGFASWASSASNVTNVYAQVIFLH